MEHGGKGSVGCTAIFTGKSPTLSCFPPAGATIDWEQNLPPACIPGGPWAHASPLSVPRPRQNRHTSLKRKRRTALPTGKGIEDNNALPHRPRFPSLARQAGVEPPLSGFQPQKNFSHGRLKIS